MSEISNNKTQVYLSVSRICSEKFGIFRLNISVLPLNSFASGCDSKLPGKKDWN